MEYKFTDIEAQVQHFWKEQNIYSITEDPTKPSYYVLDMFPYPSGAGLHVGHPLGYIASDIVARYKRLKGFCVLHPMGYDAFGLPAEQYAIQTGTHPEVTTQININRYREQLQKMGFCYDLSREVCTSDPQYYKWTQWVFGKLFLSYYNTKLEKAMPIAELVKHLEQHGTENINAFTNSEVSISAEQWNNFSELEKSDFLMNYRLAYRGDSMVNWCPELGTVLANDEVSEGLSIRGGHPVEQRKMKQWCLRITAYAERLLNGLDTLQWSESLKEMQRNWIGRSQGAEIEFSIAHSEEKFTVFTTRPDTLFGVTFMVLAPESPLVNVVTTNNQKQEVDAYLAEVKRKTERERMASKTVSGVFSGAYVKHPITGENIPIWISDYVLAGYGTGAIMAVPAHDTRDFAFAKHFNLPIVQVVVPTGESADDPQNWDESKPSKSGTLINSQFLNNLTVQEATQTIAQYITEHALGKTKVNYRLRDAIFSRQRYWGEPFPIYYKEGIPNLLSDDQLPLCLPRIDAFLPTAEGEPPLARAKEWHTKEGYPLELCTMPGFAGSCAYYLRYMDPHNENELVSHKANNYWKHVDLYIGGTEHATGHLIYSRFWNKFLFDLHLICEDEPFQKMVNQGMIQGKSHFVYRIKGTNTFVSAGKKDAYDTTQIHVDISLVDDLILDIERFKLWRPEFNSAEFILEDNNTYLCTSAVEKMSKSMFNVVNPDDIVAQYGADTLRMYEMFLGPIEQSKPWDTKGIDGVHRFLKKLVNLFYDGDNLAVTDAQPNNEELKVLHKLISKIEGDIETFSLNTSVSAFMIAVTELQKLSCNKKAILQPLLILIAPFAPHLAEHLYQQLGNKESVVVAQWPQFDPQYLVEDQVKYPISFNGKVRFTLQLPAQLSKEEVQEAALNSEEAAKWLEGKTPKKVIVVPGKIVNIVL